MKVPADEQRPAGSELIRNQTNLIEHKVVSVEAGTCGRKVNSTMNPDLSMNELTCPVCGHVEAVDIPPDY